MSSVKHNDKGFVLLESIISLSIVTFYMGIVFPFCIDLFTLRADAKSDVELYRFLYDQAAFWNSSDSFPESYHSHLVTAESVQDEKGIKISVEGEDYVSVEILSVVWE